MRVVIKPAGFLILVAMIAALAGLAFWGKPRPAAPPAASGQGSAAVAAGAEAAPDPAATDDLFGKEPWGLVATDPAAAVMKERRDAVPGVGEPVTVYSVAVTKVAPDPWAVSLRLPTPTPVAKGEKLRMVFHARSDGASPLRANFEQNGEPYNKSGALDVSPTPNWRQYTLEFAAAEDYAAEKSHTTFHCGFKSGTIEIADPHLYRVGP